MHTRKLSEVIAARPARLSGPRRCSRLTPQAGLHRGLLIAAAALLLTACRSTVANRSPVGEVFPEVTGTALSGETVTLPEALKKPAVVLIGYVQDAQFDIDRWLLGLAQLKTPIDLRELPTIRGFLPGMFAETIDSGMRSGIPEEDWGTIVTIYDDADPIVQLTGNTRPRNARVALIGAENRIVWFHDRGYSAKAVMELDGLARKHAAGDDAPR